MIAPFFVESLGNIERSVLFDCFKASTENDLQFIESNVGLR